MKYVYVLCEGPTEEGFVNRVLSPYFQNLDTWVVPITITTSKNTSKKAIKGGVSKYELIKKEIQKLCGNPNNIVTTMFDYYGMPKDTPGIDCTEADIDKRMQIIENAVESDINLSNCYFNLIVHEFEGLLFSNPQVFENITNNNTVAKLQAIRDKVPSPEHINNSPETAPSKRIYNLIPDYSKVRQGTILAQKIGIDKMISECRHFANWINKIRSL